MKMVKVILFFLVGLLIYLKELIVTMLILKLFDFETALIFSISLLIGTINLKNNRKTLNLFFRIFEK